MRGGLPRMTERDHEHWCAMDESSRQKRRNVHTAIVLAAVALGIFALFIWSSVGGVR